MPATTRFSKKECNLNPKTTRRMSAMTRCSRKESSHNTTNEMPAMSSYKRKESNYTTINMT